MPQPETIEKTELRKLQHNGYLRFYKFREAADEAAFLERERVRNRRNRTIPAPVKKDDDGSTDPAE